MKNRISNLVVVGALLPALSYGSWFGETQDRNSDFSFLDRKDFVESLDKKINNSNFDYMTPSGPSSIKDADKAWDIARMHHFGVYLDKNLEQSSIYAQRAHELGHADGAYYYSKTLPLDSMERIRILEDNASRGHSGSMYDLGVSYYEGKGVPRSIDLALFYLSKAASDGHLEAQSKRDEIISLQYERMPIEDLLNNVRQGDERALKVLSESYSEGLMINVDRDYSELLKHNFDIVDE